MQTITQIQYDLLTTEIYDSLIAQHENGLGEMGDCRTEAKRIAEDWMDKAGIKLSD